MSLARSSVSHTRSVEVLGRAMRVVLGWFGILLLLGALPSLADQERDRPKGWSLEIGGMIGYHNNVLAMSNTNGEPTIDASISTLYLNGEMGGRHARITFGVVETLYTGEVGISDERAGRLGLMLKGDMARVAAEYERSPTRVYIDDAGDELFQLESIQLRARLGESRKVWVEGRHRLQEWIFDPTQSGRNARVSDSAATLRFPIAPQLGIRASYGWEKKIAEDSQYSHDGQGRSFALEAVPSKRISLLARYMARSRAYQDSPEGSDNFDREDKIEDMTLNLRVEVGKSWGIRVEDSYRRTTSNHTDRSYHAILAKAGIFFAF